MAVKMRLMRMGKKKSPYYRVVVMDGRAPRDGRYIDLIGRYDPRTEPSVIEIDTDKAVDWLSKGAQPTETVAKLLEASGAMARHKVAAGKIHTVTGPAPEDEEPAGETPEPEAGPETTEEAPTAEAATEEEPAGDEPASAEADETPASDAGEAGDEEE